MTSDYYRRILSCLGEFSPEAFEEPLKIAYEAAGAVSRPLPFFVLWAVFKDLDQWWSERPMPVKVAEFMQNHLWPSLQGLCAAGQGDLSPEVEEEYLNAIARSAHSAIVLRMELR